MRKRRDKKNTGRNNLVQNQTEAITGWGIYSITK